MVTLSKCDKEEMGTEIKIAAEAKPTTAVAPCIRCAGAYFWVGERVCCGWYRGLLFVIEWSELLC